MTPSIMDVVIPDHDVEPPLLIESVQHIKRAPVRMEYVAESPILPQLVPVADFDVGESLAMIVSQRLKE